MKNSNEIYSSTFTALKNGDHNVLGFDMVDMLHPADYIPERYYSAYRQLLQ